MNDLNRRFAKLAGLCWHEETPYIESICSCGNVYHVAKNMIRHIQHNNPDFISDPRLVIKEMVKRPDWDDFQKQIIDPFAYLMDTTGKLVTLAIKYLDK